MTIDQKLGLLLWAIRFLKKTKQFTVPTHGRKFLVPIKVKVLLSQSLSSSSPQSLVGPWRNQGRMTSALSQEPVSLQALCGLRQVICLCGFSCPHLKGWTTQSLTFPGLTFFGSIQNIRFWSVRASPRMLKNPQTSCLAFGLPLSSQGCQGDSEQEKQHLFPHSSQRSHCDHPAPASQPPQSPVYQ